MLTPCLIAALVLLAQTGGVRSSVVPPPPLDGDENLRTLELRNVCGEAGSFVRVGAYRSNPPQATLFMRRGEVMSVHEIARWNEHLSPLRGLASVSAFCDGRTIIVSVEGAQGSGTARVDAAIRQVTVARIAVRQ